MNGLQFVQGLMALGATIQHAQSSKKSIVKFSQQCIKKEQQKKNLLFQNNNSRDSSDGYMDSLTNETLTDHLIKHDHSQSMTSAYIASNFPIKEDIIDKNQQQQQGKMKSESMNKTLCDMIKMPMNGNQQISIIQKGERSDKLSNFHGSMLLSSKNNLFEKSQILPNNSLLPSVSHFCQASMTNSNELYEIKITRDQKSQISHQQLIERVKKLQKIVEVLLKERDKQKEELKHKKLENELNAEISRPFQTEPVPNSQNNNQKSAVKINRSPFLKQKPLQLTVNTLRKNANKQNIMKKPKNSTSLSRKSSKSVSNKKKNKSVSKQIDDKTTDRSSGSKKCGKKFAESWGYSSNRFLKERIINKKPTKTIKL